jgi:hypothetical protein
MSWMGFRKVAVWASFLTCACGAPSGSTPASLGAGGTGGGAPGGASGGAFTGNAAAGSGGAAPGGATGFQDAGSSTPVYDPSVHFDWPEYDGNAGGCVAGTYVGTFECKYDDPTNPFASNIDVTGPVAFTLAESQSGEFLEIEDGKLDGTAVLIIQFTGPLQGKLDCSTNRFDAQVVNGTSLAGPFAGTLSGKLDRVAQRLSGEWNLSITTMPSGACKGPWSVTRTP